MKRCGKLGLGQIDVVHAHLLSQRPQRRLLGHEPQIDGHLVQAQAIGLRAARQFQLPLVQQPLAQ
jgi:hypothetical protein